MNFTEFQKRAHEIFDSIPPEYREGVDGLEVQRATRLHPSLPEVYTLGECKSDFYPTEFGGPGEVRSRVVLYYGSFLALSRTEDEWDWEGELWETITHEVRHHLESLAAEDELEELDYAEDQNFARRDGERFDPFFYRFGTPVAERVYEVDGDLFLELPLAARAARARSPLHVPWRGDELTVPCPEPLGDVHFLHLTGVVEEPGELVVVLIRRRGAWEWARALLTSPVLQVLQSEAEVERKG